MQQEPDSPEHVSPPNAESSSLLFENVLENANDAFFALDPDWKFTYLNRQSEHLLRRNRKELVGKNIWDEFPESVGTTFSEQYHKAAAEKISVNFEEYYPPLDSWFEVRAHPSPHGLSVYFLNINERKRTETILRESEARYRTLFNSIDEGFCVIEVMFDADDQAIDYRFLETNPSFEKLTGIPADKALSGKGISELIPNFERKWARIYGRVALSGEPIRFVEGSEALNKWFDVYAFRIGEPESKRVAVLFNNITESKQSEITLRRAKERYRALVEATSTVIWYATPTGELSLVENQWNQVSEQGAQEILNWGWLEVLHPDDREQTKRLWQEALQNKSAYSTEFRVLTREGEYRWFAVSGVPLFDDEGNVREWIGANTDIHAKRLAEDERRQAEEDRERLFRSEQSARQAAENANRLKDEFLATLSHELRTPLNAILGWSQILRNRSLEREETEKALATIERNARAQNKLIEDLLDVSRIITGKLRLNMRPVDLSTVIMAAVEAARPAAEAKTIRLQILLDPQAGLISGDPDRLQQIVWNLLSNAIKFTPKEGRVQVRLERVNSHLEVVVSDTGKGIEAMFLPHVFDRFRQADQTPTRAYGGLGLGLAIVRQLVELHGGHVSAASAGEGQGSAFTVSLPFLPFRNTEQDKTESRVHPRAATDKQLDCPRELEKLCVLVVDDERDARELIQAVLTECGAEVTLATSVAEAIERLKQKSFNVLITDIGMPEEDGYTMIRKLRALSGEQGKIPAVALTAYARAEDRVQALRSGFQMHIAKPIEPAELVAVVANMAGRATKFE